MEKNIQNGKISNKVIDSKSNKANNILNPNSQISNLNQNLNAIDQVNNLNADDRNNNNHHLNQKIGQPDIVTKQRVKLYLELSNESGCLAKFKNFFNLIANRAIEEVEIIKVVYLQFSYHGIKAKYGFDTKQNELMHKDDVEMLSEFPYVLFYFDYDFSAGKKNDQNFHSNFPRDKFNNYTNFSYENKNNRRNKNEIRKYYETINTLNNEKISEKNPKNHDIITLTIELEEFLKFSSYLDQVEFTNQLVDFRLKLRSYYDEKEQKQINILQLVYQTSKMFGEFNMKVIIYGINELFIEYNKPPLITLKNFPASRFIKFIKERITSLSYSEEEHNKAMFLMLFEQILYKNNPYLMQTIFLRKNNFKSNLMKENFILNSPEHVQKIFVFKKNDFLYFGDLLQKVKNYELYNLQWNFIEETVYKEDQSLKVNILNLLLNKKKVESDFDNETNLFGNIRIQCGIVYLEYNSDVPISELLETIP